MTMTISFRKEKTVLISCRVHAKQGYSSEMPQTRVDSLCPCLLKSTRKNMPDTPPVHVDIRVQYFRVHALFCEQCKTS